MSSNLLARVCSISLPRPGCSHTPPSYVIELVFVVQPAPPCSPAALVLHMSHMGNGALPGDREGRRVSHPHVTTGLSPLDSTPELPPYFALVDRGWAWLCHRTIRTLGCGGSLAAPPGGEAHVGPGSGSGPLAQETVAVDQTRRRRARGTGRVPIRRGRGADVAGPPRRRAARNARSRVWAECRGSLRPRQTSAAAVCARSPWQPACGWPVVPRRATLRPPSA
jgi:hypothetical protein